MYIWLFCSADAGKEEDSGSYLIDITDEKDKTVRRVLKFSGDLCGLSLHFLRRWLYDIRGRECDLSIQLFIRAKKAAKS